jgi:hypothetical protein
MLVSQTMITEAERTRPQKAIDYARGSLRLEGFVLDETSEALFDARGARRGCPEAGCQLCLTIVARRSLAQTGSRSFTRARRAREAESGARSRSLRHIGRNERDHHNEGRLLEL